MPAVSRTRPADRRKPPSPNTEKVAIEEAQVHFIEAAGQVLIDQGWRVLVAGDLKVMRWPDDAAGVYWLCMKFVGDKSGKDAAKGDHSQVRLLSKDDRDTGRKRRAKSSSKSRVAAPRKAK